MKKSLVEANPPSATKYMKRFLSPSNQERSPYSGKEVNTTHYTLHTTQCHLTFISTLPSL